MVKNQQNLINTDTDFNYFMSFLFGNGNYHSPVGTLSFKNWSKSLIKVVVYVERCISENIEVIDNSQRERLHSHCNQIKSVIENSECINELNYKTIIKLFKLIFELIGQQPDNWNLSRLNHKNHYLLDNYRSIIYIQSDKQKYNYILKLSESDSKYKLPSYSEIVKVFLKDCNGDYSKFINWFKSNYSQQYLEIF